MARLGRVVPCMFNTAVLLLLLLQLFTAVSHLPYNAQVLFRTTDQSWHGLPDAISSPPGVNRNRQHTCTRIRRRVKERSRKGSLAVYYVTDPRPSASQRLKAQAIQRASARV